MWWFKKYAHESFGVSSPKRWSLVILLWLWAGPVDLLLRIGYGTSDRMSFPTWWEFFQELSELPQEKGLEQWVAQSKHILFNIQQICSPKISLSNGLLWVSLDGKFSQGVGNKEISVISVNRNRQSKFFQLLLFDSVVFVKWMSGQAVSTCEWEHVVKSTLNSYFSLKQLKPHWNSQKREKCTYITSIF